MTDDGRNEESSSFSEVEEGVPFEGINVALGEIKEKYINPERERLDSLEKILSLLPDPGTDEIFEKYLSETHHLIIDNRLLGT